MEIAGKIIKGCDHASEELNAHLFEYLMKEFPEIVGCRKGTINVELAKPAPAIWKTSFKPIKWESMNGDWIDEDFCVTPVSFRLGHPRHKEESPRQWRKAFVFVAGNSPHFQKECFAEILTEDIEELADLRAKGLNDCVIRFEENI